MGTQGNTDKPFALFRTLPEVAFIGVLLLFWGISGVLQEINTVKITLVFYQEHNTATPPLYQYFAPSVLNGVLWLVGIIIGIGLLTYAAWARRTAVILLCVLLIAKLIVFPSYQFFGHLPIHHWLLYIYLPILIHNLLYAIMVLFLETTRVRQAWGDDGRGGRLNELAELLINVPVRPVSPLQLALILFFLVTGVEAILRGWAPLLMYMRSLIPNLLISGNLPADQLSFAAMGFYLPIGCLLVIAAIGLYRQLRWAYTLMIIAILCRGAVDLLLMLTPFINRQSMPTGDLPSAPILIVFFLLTLTGYGIQLTFLVKAFSPKQAQCKTAPAVG